MAATFAAGAVIGAAAGAGVCFFLWRRQQRPYPPRGAPVPMLPVDSAPVLTANKVAVIIGSASGIGQCAALRCASKGMKVVLADIDTDDATGVRAECIAAGAAPTDVIVQRCDCRSVDDIYALKKVAYDKFGAVHLLMNNAATQSNNKAGPYEHLERWRVILDTNLWGVYLGCLAFCDAMVAQGEPCVVVNTGSKQGITMPPGDTAYNVSKAGVKVLTEALQHKLRSTPGCKVNAFLLVPGCTNTMIRTRGDKWVQGDQFDPLKAQDERSYDGVADREYAAKKWKERGAWSADQVVDELFGAISAGTPFYVICQDYETTLAMDNGRMQWGFDDVIFRRAPLSRWSEQYKEEFKQVSAGFV